MKVILMCREFDYFFNDVKDFCTHVVDELKNGKQKRDNEQTIKNMDYEGWKTNNHCLLHRIYVKRDFADGNGMFCLVYDDHKIVSVSGVSKYNDDVVMLARRQYSLDSYKMRGMYHKYCMTPQMEWADGEGKACVILINEYNKTLYKMLVRVSAGKSGAAGQPSFEKFKGFIPLGGPFIINGAKQYVLLHKIDKNFNEENIVWTN